MPSSQAILTHPSPLASTLEGVFLVSSQPPILIIRSRCCPFLSAHGRKNLPNLYPRRRSLLLHPQQKKRYNSLQFPWTMGYKGYARTRLADSCSSLHHRCQIETVLTHDICAWEQAAKLPFPACGAEAPSTHPPRILPDTCEASKQREDPAVLQDL